MTRLSTAFSHAIDPEVAAKELAAGINQGLEGAEQLVGGLILATAAAGKGAMEVVRLLADGWPSASLFGTSFEGVLAEGRIFRNEPAYALLAWPEGPYEPVPLVFPPEGLDAAHIAEEILDASGRQKLAPGDLVLLFPDALACVQLDQLLADLGPLLGHASLAGAAATGVDGHPAEAFFADESQVGALMGLFLPDIPIGGASRVRCAGASRAASPWLEITACRSHWVDALEGEPPLDWVRRQLGLEHDSLIEPHLDQLLARIQRRGAVGGVEDGIVDYEERYVVGVDDRRGSFSLPGTFRRGDHLALALPDPNWARETLRASIDELPETALVLQFACRARDEAFYGDPDLESALVAHHVSARRVLGTVSPFQFAMRDGGACRLVVHSTVLAALGDQQT
jgi:small ligand-binding sensory domain FIST